MDVVTTFSLIFLNVTLPVFFVGQDGIVKIAVEGVSRPSLIINFGDGCLYDSEVSSSPFEYTELSNEPYPVSEIMISHQYNAPGEYVVIANASHRNYFQVSSSLAIVVEKITGVELSLLSSPLVALLQEVVVEATVMTGSNLTFEWDFGDETAGEYTVVESFGQTSIAHHSYGVADTYIISVKVIDQYKQQIIEVVLNQTVQAIEPIEQLHLQPLSGKYAAALLTNQSSSNLSFATKPVVFEASLWRGSDVEFLFDFGDGTEQLVQAILDMWSVPYGVAKHVYTEEGIYLVSVIARNLLGDVKTTLEQPFIVQLPPEGLTLDKSYYIIPRGSELCLNAAVSSGSGVSFNWSVNGNYIQTTSAEALILFSNTGTYLVTVEALNNITEEAYEDVIRPTASARVYVQEILKEVEICVISSHEGKVCSADSLDFPLDQEVIFEAIVSPPSERALRFIWEIGVQEVKKTNIPVYKHKYRNPGWYIVNVTSQNHISAVSSKTTQLHLIQKLCNLTAINSQGPNLVNHSIKFSAFYWFGTDLTFEWNFGDGSVPFQTNSSTVNHSYENVGEYEVAVFVWNKFSNASITTNMFILNYLCMKPELSFLDQSKDTTVTSNKEILLEISVVTQCKSFEVTYQWLLKEALSEQVLEVNETDRMQQQQLLLPANSIHPGIYAVHLKAYMTGTFVHASVKTSLHIIKSISPVRINGGLMRWVSRNDTIIMTAYLEDESNSSLYPFNWYCSALTQKHLPCFPNEAPLAFSGASFFSFPLPVSLFDQRLQGVIINVSAGNTSLATASQVLEITDEPRSLLISIHCDTCIGNTANLDQKLVFKVACENCDVGNQILYSWSVWLIQDGSHDLYFTHYACVHADGSTFFIMAPNSTTSPLNATSSGIDDDTSLNISSLNIDTDDTFDELPPFPKLPGFPKELDMKDVKKRNQKDLRWLLQGVSRASSHDNFLMEGEAFFGDNFSLPENFEEEDNDSPLSLEYPFDPFYGPHYPIAEEGLPGESGSAAARDQSQQRFGVFLTDDLDDNVILEGAGTGRTSLDTFVPHSETNSGDEMPGDPVRDIEHTPVAPHLVKRVKIPLLLSVNDTATDLHSEYFVLKPNVLKLGSSYMIHVTASETNGNHVVKGSAMDYLKIMVGPTSGRCTLMPAKGHSLSFLYRLHCLEWKSEFSPLFYELTYSLTPDTDGYLIYFGLNRNVKFVLPSGYTKNNYSVSLRVIVRDSRGAATKVCSLVSEVMPLKTNLSIENYIYNHTFHPKCILRKLLGEKQNQAVLQHIQVFVSTLNMHPPDDKRHQRLEAKTEALRTRMSLRHHFLETIGELIIFSKAEAAQCLSTIKEIIQSANEVTPFHLNMCVEILYRIIARKSEYGGAYPYENLQQSIISALATLAATSNEMITHGFTELFEVLHFAKNSVISEIKDMLKQRVIFEEPFHVERQGMSFSAVVLAYKSWEVFTLATKHTETVFPCCLDTVMANLHMSDSLLRCFNDRCSSPCIVVIAEEHSLFADENFHHWPSETQNYVTSYKFLICNNLKEIPLAALPLHMSLAVHFDNKLDLSNKTFSLLKSDMNIHVVNITKKNVGKSLLFYIHFAPVVEQLEPFPLSILLSYNKPPNLQNYLLKYDYISGSSFHVYIPSHVIKASGLYYLSLINSEYDQTYAFDIVNEERSYQFSASVHLCIQKLQNTWTHEGCITELSDHSKDVICRCNSLTGVSLVSLPLSTDFSVMAISSLFELYCNPLAVTLLIFVFVAYIVLLIPTYNSDTSVQVHFSPIPIRECRIHHVQKYLITVITGPYFDAGTTSAVYVVLHGEKEITETIHLASPDGKMCFHRGSSVTFVASLDKLLGPLLKLEVWHNNSGSSPSWYLSSISVEDCTLGESFTFPCYSWLSTTKGECCIEKELTLADVDLNFLKVFWRILVHSLYTINIWGSLMCSSLSSSFTGIHKLTCCLCFVLSSASLLSTVLYPFLSEEFIFPHFTARMLIVGFMIAVTMSLVQLVPAALLCKSESPSWNIVSAASNMFHAISLGNAYCWLQGKYSFRSTSSTASQSTYGGSSSFFGSYSSSNISNSEITEADLSVDKEDFGDDFSQTGSSVPSLPLNPLHKTLIAWQTLDFWLKEKKQNKSSNSSYDMYEKVVSKKFLLGMNSASHSLCDVASDTSFDPVDSENLLKTLHLKKAVKRLPVFFYYLGWFFLLSEMISAVYFILASSSRMRHNRSLQWLQILFSSIFLSCFAVFPFLAVFVATFLCIKFYWSCKPKKCSPQVAYESKLLLDKSVSTSVSQRWKYFSNYLRPPTEKSLLESRKFALKQKFIVSCCCDWPKSIVLLILLCAISFPFDVGTSYHQKLSVERAFMKSHIVSTVELWHWIQGDLFNAYYGTEEFKEKSSTCDAITFTGGYPVGQIIVKKFKSAHEQCDENMKHIPFHICQQLYEKNLTQASMNTSYGSSNSNNTWMVPAIHTGAWEEVVLNRSRYDANVQLTYLRENEWIDSQTRYLGIEFLLFNPTFALLLCIKISVEFDLHGKISITSAFFPFKLYQWSVVTYSIYALLEIAFIIVILVKTKSSLWRFMKLKKKFWKNPWNSFDVFFIIVSYFHIIYSTLYVVQLNHVSEHIRNTGMEKYFDMQQASDLEMAIKCILGFLQFLQAIGCLRLLKFNSHMYIFLQLLSRSWKPLAICGIVCLFLSLNSGYLVKFLSGNHQMSYNPLLQCIKGINLFFKGHRKPEISNKDFFGRFLFGLLLLVIIILIFTLIALIRAVLIEAKKSSPRDKRKKIHVLEAFHMLKMTLQQYFKPVQGQPVLKDEMQLPMEVLLQELEVLADRLLEKADAICCSSDEGGTISTYCSNHGTVQELALKPQSSRRSENGLDISCASTSEGSLWDSVGDAHQASYTDTDDSDSFTRDEASLQKQVKTQKDSLYHFLPAQETHMLPQSFYNEIERWSKSHKSSSISSEVLPLRKTHTVCQRSSVDFIVPTFKDKRNPVLSIHKTESRGKLKNNDLDLNTLFTDPSF